MITQAKRGFVDASAWFAYANRRDPDHDRVSGEIETFPGLMFTSNFVCDEVVTLVLYRMGHEVATRLGEFLRQSVTVRMIYVTPDDEQAAWQLFKDRPDKTCSFTDCTSFVLMRRLGLNEAIALDEDFQREGFVVRPAP